MEILSAKIRRRGFPLCIEKARLITESLEQLKQALATNWEGYENIGKMCLQVPKYGNDIDYVDSIAIALYKLLIDEESK